MSALSPKLQEMYEVYAEEMFWNEEMEEEEEEEEKDLPVTASEMRSASSRYVLVMLQMSPMSYCEYWPADTDFIRIQQPIILQIAYHHWNVAIMLH